MPFYWKSPNIRGFANLGGRGNIFGPYSRTNYAISVYFITKEYKGHADFFSNLPWQVTKSPRQVTKLPRQVTKSPRQVTKSPRQIIKSPRQVTKLPRQVTKSPWQVNK